MKKDGFARYSKPGAYSHVYRRRRVKSDWAGCGIGDAFKNNLDHHLRLPAQRLFYRMVKQAQLTAYRIGEDNDNEYQPVVKPQLSPFYTNYPSALSAHAAIGLTAFLEFQAVVGNRLLFIHLRDFLTDPVEADNVRVESNIYSFVATTVTEHVQTRLFLECLIREKSLASVEIYRLFSASQMQMRFDSFSEILRTAILYGDVAPEWESAGLYPLTLEILNAITNTSAPFFRDLPATADNKLLLLGVEWVRKICRALVKYLPPAKPNEQLPSVDTKEIAPLNKPKHPTTGDSPDALHHLLQGLIHTAITEDGEEARRGRPQDIQEPVRTILEAFDSTMKKAGDHETEWEDLRSDIVERQMRSHSFSQGSLQGSPSEGHEIYVRLADDQEKSGEIFDIPVELSEDLQACEALYREAQPIAGTLRRNLYPNIQQVSTVLRLRCSGSLDPSRLALAEICPAVFQRHRTMEQADLRGQPVLVIACDGSGSLNENQMKLLKILAAAWLDSTAKTGIRVLAALYHSGTIRENVSGPLVQWMYHPQKTMATGKREAIRAVASLPDTGTGVQSDALSIAFIMDEARRLARSEMIYFILISDTAWNISFPGSMDGGTEVYAYFKNIYKTIPAKLHVTLVGLGISEETGFEELLDKVITVSETELTDYSKVAEKIGSYVATCMRERLRRTAGQ